MAFKVVVKNGDTKYLPNSKTGQYEYKEVDYVAEFDTFTGALEEFLSWANDEYRENKVSLVAPAKKAKK